mgnify:CR=1 FL=1
MATVRDFYIFLVSDKGMKYYMNDKQDKITIIQEGLNHYEKYLTQQYCREVYGVTDIIFRH